MPLADALSAHLERGRELRLDGRLEDALLEFEAALRLDACCARAHAGHGATLALLGATGDAIASYWESLQLQPAQPRIYAALAQMYLDAARPEYAVDCFRQAVALAPEDEILRSHFVYALNFDHRASPAEIFREHCEFGRHFDAPDVPPVRWRAKRKLRIGYVSGDFRDHPVSYFFEPLLEHHRRDLFEISLYSSTAKPDFLSRRLRKRADRWREVAEASDQELAQTIRRDRIDILVDLSGHTSIARPGAFARKPAPVQVNYLGYPNTTGLPAIDYRITDRWADPPGLTERWHTEKLVRMPGGFVCYRIPDDSPAPGKPPCLRGGPVTFGSCSKPPKWNRVVIEAWAAILRRTPDSRLLLHHSTACNPAGVLESFFSHGISPDRIGMVGAIPWEEHWKWFHQVDVGLDPFPYNGTTASCETLWMGVPFVTHAGTTHVERVGASLLTRIGLEDLVGRSVEEYIALAVGLAADRPRLARLRAGMRRRMRNSTLLDGARFTREMEDAFREMWAEAGICAALEPGQRKGS
jgi:protein O-GlcNAc transferase